MSPANVEVIIDGNLANVDIKTNLTGFNGNNPAKYTSKSLGVPGIKNKMNIINSIFFGFSNNLFFSIFSKFFLLQKLYTNFLPNFLTNRNIDSEIKKQDIIINKVPHKPPVAHAS